MNWDFINGVVSSYTFRPKWWLSPLQKWLLAHAPFVAHFLVFVASTTPAWGTVWRWHAHQVVRMPNDARRRRLMRVLSRKPINNTLIDHNKSYKYQVPFWLALAALADEDVLEWAHTCGVTCGGAISSGAGFLYHAVVANNKSAVLWAQKQRQSFDVCGPGFKPVFRHLVEQYPATHPLAELFFNHASVDFAGPLGLSTWEILEQSPDWRARYEHYVLSRAVGSKVSLPSKSRKM